MKIKKVNELIRRTSISLISPALAFALAFALALALAFSLTLPCALAFADVRRSDVICGLTMDTRGIGAGLCPSIDAEYAIVAGDDGTIYFERNAYESTCIASITKIMTAVVALENATSDTQIYISENAAYIGESSANLQEGDVLDLNNALMALMIPSGNDAAVAIAESVGKIIYSNQNSGAIAPTDSDAYSAFIAAMNSKAVELGCTNTLFQNSHGLDDGDYAGDQHSCAADVSLIAQCAMQNEQFRSIVATPQAELTVTRDGAAVQVGVESTDELLGVYEGACGIKTGYTDLAGACFAGACERNGRYLYAIVLKSSDESVRFTDTQTLFDWVYENTITYNLANSSESIELTNSDGTTTSVPVVANVSLASWLDKTVKATFDDPEASIEVFSLKGNISQEFEFYEHQGSVSVGDVLGHVTFYQQNGVVAEVDLVAAEDIEAPSFLDNIGIWFTRTLNFFTGGEDTAQNYVLNQTPLILEKG